MHVEAPVGLDGGVEGGQPRMGWTHVQPTDFWPVRTKHGLRIVFDDHPSMGIPPQLPWPAAVLCERTQLR